MPKYAVAFDLDTIAMRADLVDREGLSLPEFKRQLTSIYRSELPAALAACGSLRRQQGSLYHLVTDTDLDQLITDFNYAVRDVAPNFRRYVRNVMVYPIGEARDITRTLVGPRRRDRSA